MPITVFSLLVVVLSEGGGASYSRDFPTMERCQLAEEAAHEAAKTALGVLDVGTLCVKSEFSPLVKPRA